MSGKLFLQIVVLIIIAAFAMSAVECLHKAICPKCSWKKKACVWTGTQSGQAPDVKGNYTTK